MQNDLYAHTINIHNWISVYEAQNLCQKYNIKLLDDVSITKIKIASINQVNLKRNKAYTKDKYGMLKVIDRYDMEIQINIGRLLKVSNVAMTLINNKSVTKMIHKLNDILKNTFGLNAKHSDASKWYISRIDCGIDLKLCTDNPTVLREYIKLLHDSFDVKNHRNIVYSNYKTNKTRDAIKYESITLTTQGESTNEQRYKYNIYYKFQQLLDKGVTLTNEEIKEISNVIRIEKQIYQVDKVFRRSGKLSSLLDEDFTESLMDSVRQDMLLLFGKGNYYSDLHALTCIYDSVFSESVKDELSGMYSMVKGMGYKKYIDAEVARLNYLGASPDEIKKAVTKIKDDRKKLESIGVSVASTDIVQAQTNINELLEQQLLRTRKPRKKGKFGAIIEITEPGGKKRFKCVSA